MLAKQFPKPVSSNQGEELVTLVMTSVTWEAIKNQISSTSDPLSPIRRRMYQIQERSGACITTVSWADLERQGFVIEGVRHNVLLDLADKMADDYLEQMYWSSLEIIAEDDGFPLMKKEELEQGAEDQDYDGMQEAHTEAQQEMGQRLPE